LGRLVAVEAANWLALAEGPEHPKRSRLAALRGLAAMGELVQPHAGRLRALRSDPDADLRDQALKTLIAIRDSSVAPLVGEKCKPSAAALEATPVHSVICIRDVALFGGNGRGAGPNLMPLLQSKNGAELATAIAVLGYIGYDEAIPAIREAIRAPDWRVVQAAVLSLGWLGAIEAIPDLEQVAASHWLPEVRQQAQEVLDILKSGHPKTVRPERFLMNESVPFGSYSYGIRPQAAERCPSQKWEWQGRPIARPQLTDARRVVLPFNNGLLIGNNRGEWGGELSWKGEDGQLELILKDNVVAIEPTDGGAMVLFGLAHMRMVYGYAVRVRKAEDGKWSLSEIGRLPREAQALAAIGVNLFAAWSGGRVVVFSDKEVLGLAACIP
jgi:hypothetical protein